MKKRYCSARTAENYDIPADLQASSDADSLDDARQAHDVLVERASSAGDYRNMTRITPDMLEDEVAKLFGISVEQAKQFLGEGASYHPGSPE